MAKPKKKPRHPKGNFIGGFLKCLSIFIGLGVALFACAFFFRVEEIVVEGEVRYSDQEIIDMTGVAIKDNLFFLDKPTLERRITQGLPYVEGVEITRQLPSTLHIAIEECTETLMVVQGDTAWRISYAGKLVERLDSTMPEPPYIDGCTLLAPTVGTAMVLDDQGDGVNRMESLLPLIQALDTLDMMSQLQGIHLGQPDMLTLDFASRFSVELLYGVDYEYKLRNLQIVMDSLESNEMGTINLRIDGRANFIPS